MYTLFSMVIFIVLLFYVAIFGIHISKREKMKKNAFFSLFVQFRLDLLIKLKYFYLIKTYNNKNVVQHESNDRKSIYVKKGVLVLITS